MSGGRSLPSPYTDPLRFDGAVKRRASRPLILLRRLALRLLTHVLPLMLTIIVGTFILIHSAPGSFVEIMSSEMQLSDQAMIDRLNVTYGLDKPLYVQLWKYLEAVGRLDFGFSYRQNIPVTEAILHHLPATLILMLSGLAVALLTGVASGIAAASHHNGIVDRILSMVGVFFFAAPIFWVGIMLVILFAVKLDWLPIGGMTTIGADNGILGNLFDLGAHLLMPAIALGLHQSAIYMRVTRNAMLDAAQADYVRTAFAKGLSSIAVTVRHIFRNALLPVVTVLGLQFAAVLSGSVVVEAVFNWPGLGSLLYDSVVARDYPVMLGIIIFSSLLVMVVNLIIDLVYAWLDPRIVLE
ncbi:ABC transporter permease [Asticcacaulis sp. 201]|uniref:ABC transporter permease n=1 Tax=Asticcacaulis sp. 201 TaxID=3028787 RepID=UPI002915E5C4|nr:ABC transporter permease [Asticcacaulis sp. 201]MDV6330800.1 ABC transporter permease [Asticcacaulis sp. 201]